MPYMSEIFQGKYLSVTYLLDDAIEAISFARRKCQNTEKISAKTPKNYLPNHRKKDKNVIDTINF
jgi:hypothetical protein